MTEAPRPFFGTTGPRNARIALVAETWGSEEAAQNLALVGQSGQELNRMLAAAGLSRDDVFCTNVIPAQPPDNDFQHFLDKKKEARHTVRGLNPTPEMLANLERLYAELNEVKPDLVIAAGNLALWALTPHASIDNGKDKRGKASGKKVPTGITSHRGSMHFRLANFDSDSTVPIPVLPLIHPAAILRQWELRHPTVHDLTVRPPKALGRDWRPLTPPQFLAPPTFQDAVDFLSELLDRAAHGPIRLLVDIETARGLITTIGFAPSQSLGVSIPFVRLLDDKSFDSYWTLEQEAVIIGLEQAVLTHPNIHVEGQNFNYDSQYIEYFLGVIPNLKWDSLRAQHLMWPGTPKDLGYLSSMYCDYHWYWKDDNKEWDLKGGLVQHLTYNCMDLVRNFEVISRQRELIESLDLGEKMNKELRKQRLALSMTLRGIRLDMAERARLRIEVMNASNEFQRRLLAIMPQEWVEAAGPASKAKWFSSPQQAKWVLYDHFKFDPIIHRKTGSETTGKEALNELRDRHPEYSLLFDLLGGLRSLGVFQNTFLGSAADPDGRMRSFFGVAETHRWTSAKNAFGRGANLQNIPEGNEDKK